MSSVGAALAAVSLLAGTPAPPLGFEPNFGQFPEAVCFFARPPGYQAYLTAQELVLVLAPESRSGDESSSAVLRFRLDGANPAPDVRGVDPLPGRIHRYGGSDPARWVTDVPTYARVEYRQVYPGIDMVFYGQPNRL